MRRGNQRALRITVLAAAIAASIVLVTPVLAGHGSLAYDDRPALLAHEVPEDLQRALHLETVELAGSDAEGRAEIVLAADGALPYDVFELNGPDRIVIDLPGIRADELGNVEFGGTGIIRVRVGQYREAPEAMARVVFDLNGPHGWDVEREGDSLRVRLAPVGTPIVSVSSNEGTVVETLTEVVNAAPAVVTPTQPIAEVVSTTTEPAGDEIGALIEGNTEPVAQTEVPAALAFAARPEPSPASTTLTAAAVETASTTQVGAEPVTTTWTAPSVEKKQAAAVPTTTNAPSDTTWEQPEIASIIDEAAGIDTSSKPAKDSTVTYLSENASSTGIVALPSSETKMIDDSRRAYTGRPISTNLVDADIKQVFSLFHEISGLNFVLDPAVRGTVTIVVDNVPWDQALDLILKNNGLDMVMEGNVIRIAPVQKLAQEAQARKALYEAKELQVPPVIITRTLSYAKAKDVEKIIRDAIVSPKGRVIVDDRTNTLIIRDVPARVEATDKLLSTLDSETPQVMIEARIVEVSRDFVKDLGIQWGTSAIADASLGTQTSLDFPHSARVDYDLNLPRAAGANALGFSFGNVLNSFTLDITLDALETEGYARRLSSPKIATQNNEPAEIEQGLRIPIVSTTATEIDVRFVSASLRLKVTPQITAEGTVVLEVEVENNSPDFVNTVGEVPAINTQRAQTKVLIGDNGTTVIGGIFTVNEGKSTSGVPWFRDIPGLGWLFRSRNEQIRNRELLIFITPRIIKAS